MREAEQKKKIVEYFKKNLKKGYTIESLKWALVNQGYSRTLIELSLKQANLELAEEAPVIREKPVIKYEVLDQNDIPVEIKKPWWKKLFEIE